MRLEGDELENLELEPRFWKWTQSDDGPGRDLMQITASAGCSPATDAWWQIQLNLFHVSNA